MSEVFRHFYRITADCIFIRTLSLLVMSALRAAMVLKTHINNTVLLSFFLTLCPGRLILYFHFCGGATLSIEYFQQHWKNWEVVHGKDLDKSSHEIGVTLIQLCVCVWWYRPIHDYYFSKTGKRFTLSLMRSAIYPVMSHNLYLKCKPNLDITSLFLFLSILHHSYDLETKTSLTLVLQLKQVGI